MPGGGGPGKQPDNTSKDKEKDKGGHQRTEFILLFIWVEPTPSDKLRGMDEGTPPASAPATK